MVLWVVGILHHICHIAICCFTHQGNGSLFVESAPFALLVFHGGAHIIHFRVVEVSSCHQQTVTHHVQFVRQIPDRRVNGDVLHLLQPCCRFFRLFFCLPESDGAAAHFLPVVHVQQVQVPVTFHHTILGFGVNLIAHKGGVGHLTAQGVEVHEVAICQVQQCQTRVEADEGLFAHHLQFVDGLVIHRLSLQVRHIPTGLVHPHKVNVPVFIQGNQLLRGSRIGNVLDAEVTQGICLVIEFHAVVFGVETEQITIGKHEDAGVALHSFGGIVV